MNIGELVADLSTKCVWVGAPQVTQGSIGAPVIEIAPEGKYSAPRNFAFTAFNVGVVAGPDGSVIQQRVLVDTDSNGDARHAVIA